MAKVSGSLHEISLCSVVHAGWSEWGVALLPRKIALVLWRFKEVSFSGKVRVGVIGGSSVARWVSLYWSTSHCFVFSHKYVLVVLEVRNLPV